MVPTNLHPPTKQTVSGEKTLEEFKITTFNEYDLLVLESVDEDAQGADATFRDGLIMLAHYDPTWREELRKYLQEEERKRRKMKGERAMRLARWRPGGCGCAAGLSVVEIGQNCCSLQLSSYPRSYEGPSFGSNLGPVFIAFDAACCLYTLYTNRQYFAMRNKQGR